MKKLISYIMTLLLVISLVPVQVQAQEESIDYEDYSNISQGEVIVTYSSSSHLNHVDKAIDGKKVSLDSSEKTIVEVGEDQDKITSDTALLSLEDDVSIDEAIDTLEDLPDVESVQPNYLYALDETEVTTNDPGLSSCYYLDNIHMKEAWAVAKTEKEVTVAVVDTGCNLQHEDLVDNLDVDHAYDAVNSAYLKNESIANNGDAVGHGTHVCGLIAATANNEKGIAGTSYNAKVLPVNVFSYSESAGGYVASTSALLAAYSYIDTLIGNGRTDIKVVNMSLGGYNSSRSGKGPHDIYNQPDSQFETAVNNLLKKRQVLSICAAGNESTSAYMYPSDYDACISVEASTSTNEYASFTNISTYKDITAPGVSIYSCLNTGGYGNMSGTSMATPIVSGVVALLYSLAPSTVTAEQVRTALYTGATEITNKKFNDGSHGIVNAYNAVVALQTTLGIQTSCKHTNGTVVLNAKAATCKDSGYTGDKCCASCGAVITAGSIIPKTNDHTWDDGVTVAATCESAGTTTYTCSVCGIENVVTNTPALGHDYGDWTYTSDNKHQRVCSRDDTHVEEENCDYTYEIVTEPTHTSTGVGRYTCSKCNHSYDVTIHALSEHSWNSGTVTKEATCTSTGVKTYTCTVCGETKTETIAKTSHTYSGYIGGYDATCTTGAYTGHRECTVCHTILDYGTTGQPLGHAYIDTVVAPTELTGGYTVHTCVRCGASYTDSYTSQTAKVISKSIKYSKVKKKKQTVSCKLTSSTYKKATYKKMSGSGKLSISSKGIVTVKKGTKKGTYTIRVRAYVKKAKSTKAKTKYYYVQITVA